jgi:hypothetical protein
MHRRGVRTTVAAFSGLALASALAGCGVQTVDATVVGPANASKTAAPAAATPTPSATPTVTAVPTSAAKAPTAPTTTKPAAAAPAPSKSPSASPSAAPPAPPAPSSVYKDGNYSATGRYNSPGGSETLRVTLDLKDDVVTAIAVTSVHVDSTAANYEAAFESGIGGVVIGKPIASLNVGAVGGSSLTCLGFNKALATIKGQAEN